MNKCVRVCKSKRNNTKDCERDQKFSFLALLLSFLGVSCIRNQAKEISLVSFAQRSWQTRRVERNPNRPD